MSIAKATKRSTIEGELAGRLESIRSEGLYRELRPLEPSAGPHVSFHGRELVNFASNDYLGLSQHPRLKEAAIKATERFGVGSGASRLISGSWAVHHELEESLAAFKKTESALSFATGYAAALGAICSLVDHNDVIAIDHLVHASIVDAARLSGAKLRVFEHNDLDDLERILQWADRKRVAPAPSERKPRTLVVTESVFSMDGDQAPLRELADLKDRYGAWLMVDEAHATGIFGRNRSGLIEHHGLVGRVEVQMGTLGKAVGAAGGFVCGSRHLIDLLINRARSFIFSTAPMPAAAAAACAGTRVIQSTQGKKLCRQLWDRVEQAASGLAPLGLASLRSSSKPTSAILPIIIGDEARAVALSDRLRSKGMLLPAIRYPSVARGQARLRLTLSAAHTEKEVDQLIDELLEAGAGH